MTLKKRNRLLTYRINIWFDKTKFWWYLVIWERALLVQLVERRFPKPDVEGSSPSGRVKDSLYSSVRKCYIYF